VGLNHGVPVAQTLYGHKCLSKLSSNEFDRLCITLSGDIVTGNQVGFSLVGRG
jgi:hypothetical protein